MFREKDILSIVNQVSSKNPGEGAGQFGTGFMTAYQLSEPVEIRSVLKEDGFPGKRFRVTLDRTGHGKEEILRAIFYNPEQLQNVDELPDVTEHETGTDNNTEFCYMLENKRSRQITRTGVTDLADTILYVMLFSEGIYNCKEAQAEEVKVYKNLLRQLAEEKLVNLSDRYLFGENGNAY